MKITTYFKSLLMMVLLCLGMTNAWGQAELPFTFNGGRSNISSTQGLSHSQLGTDYSNADTKLKFDHTGDNLTLHFTGEADVLTFTITFNGSGTFGGAYNVLGSSDGIDFSVPLFSLGEHAANSNIEYSVSDIPTSVKYIRWIYTNKSSGNIGLGKINLTANTITTPCSGTPNAGMTSVSPTSGSPDTDYVVSASGYSTGATDLSYQWEYNINGAGWSHTSPVNIPATTSYLNYSATNDAFAPAVGQSVEWRLVTTCTNGGASNTSSIATFTSVLTYCDFSLDSDFEYISNVTIGSEINNTTGKDGYSYYPSPVANLNIDSSTPISVTISDSYISDNVYLYIDWNQDGDFGDTGEVIALDYDAGTYPFVATGSIIPPAGASLGNTRLRIKLIDGSNDNPCDDSNDYGEIEDYTVNVSPASTEPTLSVSLNHISDLNYMEGSGPSEAQSFELSGVNLDGTDVTITTLPYFEISETETGPYSNSISLTTFDGTTTSIWVRLTNGLSVAGYYGEVTISGGGTEYLIIFSGVVSEYSDVCLEENFGNSPIGYTFGSITLSSGEWYFNNASTHNQSGDLEAQLRNATDSYISTPTLNSGVESVSFKAYRTSGNGSALQVNYSTDGGVTWTAAIGSPFNLNGTKSNYTAIINTDEPTIIQFRRTAATVRIDDVEVTCNTTPPCTTPAPSADAEQAFCPGATVADLEAIGNDIKWYDSETATEPLLSTQGLTHNVTYYVSQTIDDCESERIAVTVVQDDVPPTPVVENLDPIQAECKVNEADLTPPTATDNCGGTVTVTHNAIFPITETTTITWTFTDESDNWTTQEQVVTIQDTTAPVPDTAELEDIVEQCEVLESDITPPTATDNCDDEIIGTTDTTFPITETTTITWTFTDETGNSITQVQEVIIEDTIAPVPNTEELPGITMQCEVLESDIIVPTANDNCDDEIVGTTDTTFPITETTTVTWTFTDETGNSITQVQEVIIEDTIAPVPDTAELEDIVEQCEVLESDITPPTATDNCDGIITATHNATFPITETTTITWTYADESGNTTTQEQVVTIQDTIAPVPNEDELEDIVEQCQVIESQVTAPTANDNCDGIITATHNATFPITETTTITWTFTDETGNTTTQEQEVIIQDTIAPEPNEIELEDIVEQCQVIESQVTAPTANDNCDGIITATHNATFPITETTTITWTYEDQAGNTTTQEQEVIIQDTIAPEPDDDKLEDIVEQCQVIESQVTAPTANDNCDGIITATHNATFPITETTTITWTYEDETGNTTTQEQEVIIQDTIAPEPNEIELEDIVEQCELLESQVTPPTATDNCGGTVTVAHDATFPITETTTITWTFTDESDNWTTQEQVVTIQDTTAPVPNKIELEDIVEQCELLESQVTPPTATDNCGGTVTVAHDATFPITETTTITWTFTDESDNWTTQEQEVIIQDTTAPVPNEIELEDIVEQCELLESQVTPPTATDNCSGTVTVTHNATFPITETTTITWTFTDESDNWTTQEQEVIIQDTTAPVPNEIELEDIVEQCELLESQVTPPTATDNCSGTVTVTHNATFPITETTTITWTFTDESDNWTTQEQVVTIQDTIAPVPVTAELEDIVEQCEVLESDITPPTATDNCGGTVTVAHDATFPITETTTITWTFTDESDNWTTQEQVVTIQDTIAPVPVTAELEDIVEQCEVLESDITPPTATDNCDDEIVGTTDITFPITETTTITWTFTDETGNSITQVQEVIIEDTIAPVPNTEELPGITMQCEVLESDIIVPTATDNCDGEIIGTTDITFPITETTTITWTFTDETGNSITQVQEVIIEDTIAPVPNTEELPGITMQCEVLESDITVPTANDNCDGIITATHNATFPITETTTITWTYADESGNTTTQEQIVTVLPSVIENVILNDVSATYDGSMHQIEVDNLPDGATVTYNVNPTTENDNGATEAGIYEITAVVNPPSTAINCDDVVLTATLTIEKAILDITLEDATFLRDCTAHSLIISGDLPSGVNVTYTGNEQTETGTHTVTANIDGGNNYENLTLTATMTIQEVQPEITNYHSCGDFLTQDVVIDLPSGWEARWYDSASSTTPITTIQNSGIYYVSAITNNCESERVEVAVTVVHVQTPSGNTDQIFCGSATVTDLIVNHSSGSTLNVYDSEFGGTALSSGSSLNSSIYYISEQIDNCESERLAVNVTVIAISTPTTNVEHEFCDSATIEDLLINHTAGSTLLVYESLTQENPLAPGSALYTGTFYVSEKIGICESDRLAVQVSVVQTPDSLAPQTITICGFEVLQNITLGELPIADLVWYANETTLQPMNANSQVYSGTLYASQKVGICESPRTAITFEVNEVVPQPTANSQSFCESAVVSNLIVTGVEGAIFRWFDSATSTTPLANDEPLSNGTYYVSQELNGCESSRKAISVQVINIAAPQIANMSLCSGMTIAEVEIPATTGITHKWYISPVAITALSPNTLLANNTYYISKVYNGCESERVAVDVEIVPVPNAPTGESEQSFVYNFSINEVTIADLLVNEENVLWFAHPDDAATLTNPLQSNMPLANNTTYYAVIVNDYGCVSDYLAVTVTVVLGEKRFDRAKLHYYPNPTQGILYIEYANIIENVEVYNAVGQLVKSQDFDSNKVTLDINELSNGTYLLKLSINGQQQLIKVMKK